MWNAWLDLALGSRCIVCADAGRVLCVVCAENLPAAGVRIQPDPVPPGLAPVFVAGRYAEPLKSLLIAHKEHRVFGLAEPLGRLLAVAVEAAHPPADSALLLVGIPSSRRTVRTRGHDPVRRMVTAAARELQRRGRAVLAPALLRQHLVVADQAGLGAGDRALNLAGALRVDPVVQRGMAGRSVTALVCDDIVTTGTTAREAQRALAAVGIEIGAIAAVAATEKRRVVGPQLGRLLPNC